MTAANNTVNPLGSIWSQYRDNFPRQVIGINRYAKTHVMERLTEEYRFSGLRMYFEPYISLASPEGIRLTDLSNILDISRQAVNQSVNQLEVAGYIQRKSDPSDGRSKLIVLTPRGQELRERGIEISRNLELEFLKILGKETYKAITKSLYTFCQKNDLLAPSFNIDENSSHSLIVLLPRFSEHLKNRLMELTSARGHQGLKLSYSQVLELIGPEGGRILQIAKLQNVSKQAISAIANELEGEGYIYRHTDTTNAKQTLLHYTPRGCQLIEDSVNSIRDLEEEIAEQIGNKSLATLRSGMKKLYHTLQPEQAAFLTETPKLEEIVRELRRKLSPEAIQRLVSMLQSGT